jgi:predicted membrane protein
MAARQGPPGSLAARVTYLLEPKNWLIVTVVDPAGRPGCPALLCGYLLVGLLGWSRVAVRAHTTPQVVSGSVLGAAAAFLACAAIVA